MEYYSAVLEGFLITFAFVESKNVNNGIIKPSHTLFGYRHPDTKDRIKRIIDSILINNLREKNLIKRLNNPVFEEFLDEFVK